MCLLPKDFICPYCGNKLEINVEDIKGSKLVCPECKCSIDMTDSLQESPTTKYAQCNCCGYVITTDYKNNVGMYHYMYHYCPVCKGDLCLESLIKREYEDTKDSSIDIHVKIWKMKEIAFHKKDRPELSKVSEEAIKRAILRKLKNIPQEKVKKYMKIYDRLNYSYRIPAQDGEGLPFDFPENILIKNMAWL